jgi:hypothetical protein
MAQAFECSFLAEEVYKDQYQEGGREVVLAAANSNLFYYSYHSNGDERLKLVSFSQERSHLTRSFNLCA